MSKLAVACEMSLNDWLATFPDEIPKAEYTEKHEKWKRNLFNKMRDDHYHRFTTKTIKVMLVAAVLMALLMTAFVFPSSRESTLNNLNAFSIFRITKHNKNSVNGEIKVGYIPEGFELENIEHYSKYLKNIYQSDNGKFFTITKGSSSMKMEFDTENFVTEEMIIDNTKYVYCTGNFGMNSIIWTRNDYVYQIDAPFEKEELLKIAKTVE